MIKSSLIMENLDMWKSSLIKEKPLLAENLLDQEKSWLVEKFFGQGKILPSENYWFIENIVNREKIGLNLLRIKFWNKANGSDKTIKIYTFNFKAKAKLAYHFLKWYMQR